MSLQYPIFNDECPECGAETKRYPEGDSKISDVECFRCINNHEIMVEPKHRYVFSISIPFKHLQLCPKCRRGPLKVTVEKNYPCADGTGHLVVYKCPSGHSTPHRQLVLKKPGLPPKKVWEDSDY